MAKYPEKTVIKLNSQGRPANKYPEPTFTQEVQKIPIAEILKRIPRSKVKAPRDACMDCVRKHIAQAIILLQESLLGYPEHKWLAVGHLAEASEECLGEFPAVAQLIRLDRLAITDDDAPDLMKYLRDDFELLTTEQALPDSQ